MKKEINNEMILEKYGVEYDYSEIPLNGSGNFDWKNSIGKSILFEYGFFKGKIEIVGYERFSELNRTYITIKYGNDTKRIMQTSVKNADGFKELIFGVNFLNTKKIGDKVTGKNGKEFMVVGVSTQKEKNTNGETKIRPYYRLRCLKCGNEIVVDVMRLVDPPCYVCSNRKIIHGINDIATTDPWMIPYFQNPEDTKKYSKGSTHEIIPKCPICGTVHDKSMQIASLCAHGGFRCNNCNDYIPFAEKYMMSVLNQLGIKYKHEVGYRYLPFDCGKKRYDFYIEDYSCIIEAHGGQHYKDVTFKYGYYSKYKDVQKNDLEKYELAKDYIDNYIVLDCRESTPSWIKKSIMSSKLPELFNFTEDDIDWDQCYRDTSSSITKKICEDYHNNYMTTQELCDKYSKCLETILKILRFGNKMGWCTFTTFVNTNKNPVEICKDGKHLAYAVSPSNLSIKLRKYIDSHSFSQSAISKALRTNTNYKEYVVKYVEDIQTKWDILNGIYDNELKGVM